MAEDCLPFVLKGKYFKIVSSSGLNVVAECQLCLLTGKNHNLKGSKRSTTNFRDHIKRCHESVYRTFVNEASEAPKAKKSRITTTEEEKCAQVLSTYVKRDPSKTITNIDKLVVNFVIGGMHQLSIVNEPGFRNLCNGLKPGVEIMRNDKLTGLLKDRFATFQNNARQQLKKAGYLCLTSDLWTCNGMTRGFLGMTAHWITSQLERKSLAIACRRFTGTHSAERIAKGLVQIIQEYEIEGKVLKIITDNASNYGKAFREHTTRSDPLALSEYDDGIEQEQSDDEYQEDNLDADFADLDTCLRETAIENSNQAPVLPPHHKCASHTLSLICTSDLRSYKNRTQKAAFAKCYSIWNRKSRSTSTCEQLKALLGKSMKTPVCTRWNSLYDSIVSLLEDRGKLSEVCKISSTPCFTEAELEFLTNYCACVKPIAEALDKLQGENNTFYGTLAPTLIATEVKLVQLTEKKLPQVGNLSTILLTGLRKRFEPYLKLSPDVNDAIIATVSHPRFKLRWVPASELERIKQMFIDYCTFHGVITVPKSEEDALELHEEDEDDKFFLLPSTGKEDIQSSQLERGTLDVKAQALEYLSDPSKNLEMLSKYDYIKRVFEKFNTPLPSSAPVERLFNYANMILRPNRRNLRDDHFEMLLLTKVNGEQY